MARTDILPPVPAKQLLMEKSPAWHSASLPPCHVDPKHLIYMHSEVAGQPGYRVITACPVAAGEADMLIDLGFVSQPLDAVEIPGFSPIGRLRPFEKPGMVTPVNRPTDNDWYWRVPSEMGKALGTSVRGDYFLVADLKASQVSLPGLQQGPLNPSVSVPPERHLEYALTWFGLAWVMFGMFIAFAMQRARGK